MINKLLLVGLFSSTVLIGLVYAEETKLTITAGLLNETERSATYEKILEQRVDTIKELISIIEQKDVDKSFLGPLNYAISLLSKLRAKEAVEALSNLLIYIPPDFRTREILRSEHYYVAAVALVEIGNPSIDAMLTKIQKSDSEEERNLATWVIMEIEGKKQALNRMNLMIKKDGLDKDRFESAKKYIENYKPIFGHPKKK